MAILSNINGLFAVEDNGAIKFNNLTGTNNQVLIANTNSSPTWVNVDTIIGGPYLPLTGGILSGALAGTSATFTGNVGIGGTLLDFTAADFAQIKFRESGAIMIDSDNDQSSRNFAIKDGDGTNLLLITDTGNSTFAGSITTTSTSGVISPLGVFSTASLNTNVFRFIKTGNVGYNWQFPATDSIRFGPDTGSDKKLSFTNTGAGNFLVGIGTDSPTAPLTVQSAGSASAISIIGRDNGTADESIIDFYQNDGTTRMAYMLADDGNLDFASGGSTVRMRIASGGLATFKNNVELDSTTPTVSLEGRNSGNSGAVVQLLGWAATYKNWRITTATAGAGTLNFRVSSSAGGDSGWATVGTIDESTGAYVASSDINRKKDLEDSKIGLKEVMELQPKLYRMKEDNNDSNKHLGFIAQEVEKVLPQAYLEQGEDDNKFIGLTEMPIVAALTKAIQELTAKVEMLEKNCNCK